MAVLNKSKTKCLKRHESTQKQEITIRIDNATNDPPGNLFYHIKLRKSGNFQKAFRPGEHTYWVETKVSAHKTHSK